MGEGVASVGVENVVVGSQVSSMFDDWDCLVDAIPYDVSEHVACVWVGGEGEGFVASYLGSEVVHVL